MNVAGQMQIEFFHGHHLGISATGRPTLDAKGGPLAGLSNARDRLFAQNGAEGLGETNGGGGFPFSQRRGIDAGDDDIVPIGYVFASLSG